MYIPPKVETSMCFVLRRSSSYHLNLPNIALNGRSCIFLTHVYRVFNKNLTLWGSNLSGENWWLRVATQLVLGLNNEARGLTQHSDSTFYTSQKHVRQNSVQRSLDSLIAKFLTNQGQG